MASPDVDWSSGSLLNLKVWIWEGPCLYCWTGLVLWHSWGLYILEWGVLSLSLVDTWEKLWLGCSETSSMHGNGSSRKEEPGSCQVEVYVSPTSILCPLLYGCREGVGLLQPRKNNSTICFLLTEEWMVTAFRICLAWVGGSHEKVSGLLHCSFPGPLIRKGRLMLELFVAVCLCLLVFLWLQIWRIWNKNRTQRIYQSVVLFLWSWNS